MIVTISGTAGSGKSSVGRAIAKILKYKFYSAGEVRGKYAVEHGMTLAELNKKAETDPTSDHMVDNYMVEMGKKEDNIVVDGRVAFLMIPRSIKVFIDAELEVRAERIFKDNREREKFKSMEEAIQKTKERQESDERRYVNLYKINPFDHTHYDLVIDSSEKPIEEIAGEVYRFVMFKENELNKKK
jgi:CMP/dCMP kinase